MQYLNKFQSESQDGTVSVSVPVNTLVETNWDLLDLL